MPEIGLANDVTLEYEKGVDDEANYRFTTDLPNLGEFAKEGILFSLQTRREPEGEDEFLYKFKSEEGVLFTMFEDTFYHHMDEENIVKVDT